MSTTLTAQRRREIQNKPSNRAREMKRVHRLLSSVEEIIEVKKQKVCAVCGKKQPPPNAKRKTLDTDHCHKFRRVRAMLCRRCNMIAVDAGLVRKVLAYLEKWERHFVELERKQRTA
jgi:hypothetical protein